MNVLFSFETVDVFLRLSNRFEAFTVAALQRHLHTVIFRRQRQTQLFNAACAELLLCGSDEYLSAEIHRRALC